MSDENRMKSTKNLRREFVEYRCKFNMRARLWMKMESTYARVLFDLSMWVRTNLDAFLERLTSLNCGFSLIYCHLIPLLTRAALSPEISLSITGDPRRASNLSFDSHSRLELTAYRPDGLLLDTFRSVAVRYIPLDGIHSTNIVVSVSRYTARGFTKCWYRYHSVIAN